MFLFEGRVEKSSLSDDRTSQSYPGAIAVKAWPGAFGFERIPGIERAILQEDKSVAVHRIGAGSRNYVDGPSRRTTGLGSQAGIDHLKLLHCLQ